MSLKGKVAVITGGTKGIGRSTAIRLAAEGASVVVNYSRDSKAADSFVEEIGKERALAVQADASNIDGIETLVESTVDRFGKIDILIPNAGVMPMADLEHLTEETYQRIMNLNVKGPLFLVQKAAPHMPSGSHIILVSTTLCVSANITPGYLPYIMSKGAIEQMTRVLAKDLGRKGIRVNAIAPGPTGTDLFLQGKSEQVIQAISSGNPFNKLGTPEEIADVMCFLSGDGSRWVSGQVVRVNGAMA